MDRDEIIESVKFLQGVSHKEALTYNAALKDIVGLLGRYSLRFRGEFAVLNPLVALFENDEKLFDSVVGIINKHRPDTVFSKATNSNYMKDLMRDRRHRERRAVNIENAKRPADKQLKGQARAAYVLKVGREWGERRERMLDGEREKRGGKLAMEVVSQLTELFWETVDAELDAQEIELGIRG